MKIDTAGTYTLQYTAEDECGNTTTVEREITIFGITYRTVLYTDGTFIINEESTDISANVAKHGVATNVYEPFDPNGSTNTEKYMFGASDVLWFNEVASILSVEFGTPIQPTDMSYWFRNCSNVTQFDWTNLDTSRVTRMSSLFSNCSTLTSLDLSNFDTSEVESMANMFEHCTSLVSLNVSSFDTRNATYMINMFLRCSALVSLDVSNFNTENVTDMSGMFCRCSSLRTLDLSNFNTEKVTGMYGMFGADTNFNSQLEVLDISNFSSASLTNASQMFKYLTSLKTIYATNAFALIDVAYTTSLFSNMSYNLVGGSGTVWSAGYVGGAYARVDNPPDAPGYFTLKS